MEIVNKDYVAKSHEAYKNYEPNITEEQKDPANMFIIGYQAAYIELLAKIEEQEIFTNSITDPENQPNQHGIIVPN